MHHDVENAWPRGELSPLVPRRGMSPLGDVSPRTAFANLLNQFLEDPDDTPSPVKACIPPTVQANAAVDEEQVGINTTEEPATVNTTAAVTQFNTQDCGKLMTVLGTVYGLSTWLPFYTRAVASASTVGVFSCIPFLLAGMNDEIDKRATKLEGGVARLEGGVTQLQYRFTIQEAKMDKLAVELASHFEVQDAKMDAQNAKIDAMLTMMKLLVDQKKG